MESFSRFAITARIRGKSYEQSGAKVQQLHTDHGSEYHSKEFLRWLKEQGVALRPTVAYHSETNAVAERFNRTIITMIRANLSRLPKVMWELALEYSTFIKNCIPHSAIQAAPIERAIPSISVTKQCKLFRPFGEQAYIHT